MKNSVPIRNARLAVKQRGALKLGVFYNEGHFQAILKGLTSRYQISKYLKMCNSTIRDYYNRLLNWLWNYKKEKYIEFCNSKDNDFSIAKEIPLSVREVYSCSAFSTDDVQIYPGKYSFRERLEIQDYEFLWGVKNAKTKQ